MEYWEREKLANQCRILEHLEDEAAASWRKARIIFEKGYTRDYNWAIDWVRREETGRETCEEVFDILEMHSQLKHSYEKLDGVSDVEEGNIKLRGFDGNHEADHLDYARFVVGEDEKYPELKENVGNSHAPTLERYRDMVAKWEDRRGGSGQLSAEDIRAIVEAGNR